MQLHLYLQWYLFHLHHPLCLQNSSSYWINVIMSSWVRGSYSKCFGDQYVNYSSPNFVYWHQPFVSMGLRSSCSISSWTSHSQMSLILVQNCSCLSEMLGFGSRTNFSCASDHPSNLYCYYDYALYGMVDFSWRSCLTTLIGSVRCSIKSFSFQVLVSGGFRSSGFIVFVHLLISFIRLAVLLLRFWFSCCQQWILSVLQTSCWTLVFILRHFYAPSVSLDQVGSSNVLASFHSWDWMISDSSQMVHHRCQGNAETGRFDFGLRLVCLSWSLLGCWCSFDVATYPSISHYSRSFLFHSWSFCFYSCF